MGNIINLRDSHVGKRCFVLGNGPSLADHDLTHLVDEHVFCSNRFFLHETWPLLKNVFWFDLCGASFTIENMKPVYNSFALEHILKNPNAKFVFSTSWLPFFKGCDSFPIDRTYYLRLRRDHFVGNGEFQWDISRGSYFASTTTIEGLMALAQYMGFKEIYLLGCDNTGYVKGNEYFYKTDALPQVYQPKYGDNPDYDDMYNSWITVSKLFPERGIKIYNASDKGKLDMFERVNYEALFE